MNTFDSLPGDSSINKHRHSSIPLSTLKQLQRYGRPQDTNYIGITITDQEETAVALDTTWTTQPTLHETETLGPQTYRHSFNNMKDLVNLQRQQRSAYPHAHIGGATIHQRQETQQVEEKGATLDHAPAPDLTRHSPMVLPRLTLNQPPSQSSPIYISHQDLPPIPRELGALNPDNAPSASPELISTTPSSSNSFVPTLFLTSSISPIPLHTNRQRKQSPILSFCSEKDTFASQTINPSLSHHHTLTSKSYTLPKSGAFRRIYNHQPSDHLPPLQQKSSSSSSNGNKVRIISVF